MRKAGGPEDQGEGKGDEVEPADSGQAVLQPRIQQGIPATFGRRPEQRGKVEAVKRQHPDRHDESSGDEEPRLDDLHPGGALHPADEHIDDHENTDHTNHYGLADLVIDAEQQGDQTTGPGHLGEQVEEADRKGRRRRCEAYWPLLQPERQHVGHREFSRVAHEFCHEQQRDKPRDEESD